MSHNEFEIPGWGVCLSSSERRRLRSDLTAPYSFLRKGGWVWGAELFSLVPSAWTRGNGQELYCSEVLTSELAEGVGCPQSCLSLSMGSDMFREGGMYFLVGVRAVDHLEIIWPPEQIFKIQYHVLFLKVFCIHPVFLVSPSMAKSPSLTLVRLQRLNPESDTGTCSSTKWFQAYPWIVFLLLLIFRYAWAICCGKRC